MVHGKGADSYRRIVVGHLQSDPTLCKGGKRWATLNADPKRAAWARQGVAVNP